MKRAFIVLALLFSPCVANAQVVADLGFHNQDDIFFSTDQIIAGKTMRIYASIENFGSVDMSGYVSFHQGTIPIGDSQVISVRADGADEEVFVDFVIPEQPFNIRAEIKGTDPDDENSANDVVISNLFTPIHDDDEDGVADETDNCPDEANSSQTDTDGDGLGNACDDDDDNDTLTDEVEDEMGTNPEETDSDGDGVPDSQDFAPTDPAVTKKPADPVAPSPAPAPETAPDAPSVAESEEADVGENEDEDGEEEAEETAEDTNTAERQGLQISPKAIFSYEQVEWNTFRFAVSGFDGAGYRYEWDFGDGVKSSRDEVEHTYRSFGDYTVTLTVTSPDGDRSSDSADVSVSFFNFENPYLKMLLGFLLVLFLISVGILVRTLKRNPSGAKRANKKGQVMPLEDAIEDMVDAEPLDGDAVADEGVDIQDEDVVEDKDEDEREPLGV